MPFRRATCQVPTDVMEPTILKGSEVVLDTAYYYHNPPKRWDIVVFFAPELEELRYDLGRVKVPDADAKSATIANAASDIFQNTGFPVRPHIIYIKRIVGLPGELIRFEPSQILCNGVPLKILRDLQPCFSSFPHCASYRFGATDCLVPDDSVFFLSDNVARGKDSREIGPVKIGNFVGRIVR
jgi:signal peptidase I